MNFMTGLIGGALAGGAKGVSEIANAGLEKENKLDMARQLNEIDLEKQKRIDEYHASDAYLQQQGNAALAKGRIDAQNRTTLAPETAGAARAEYEAGKPLDDLKSQDEIKRFSDKWTNPDYVAARKAEVAAGETSAVRASGAEGMAKAAREQEINNTLRALKDPKITEDQRTALTQRLSLLRTSGGEAAYPYQIVPIRDENGDIVGQKVFDRVHGKWVEDKPSGPGGNSPSPAPGKKKPWEMQ